MDCPVNTDIEILLDQCWEDMVRQPRSAEKLAIQAKALAEVDSVLYVKAICYQGTCLVYMGAFDNAISMLNEGLSIAGRNNQEQNIYQLQKILGLCYQLTGRYSLAIQHYEICAEIARKSDNTATLTAAPLINIAIVLFDVGDILEAEQVLAEALSQDLSTQVPDNLVEISLLQAQIFLANDNIIEAEKALDVASKLAIEVQYTIGVLRCNIVRGRLCRMSKNTTGAIDSLLATTLDSALITIGVGAIYAFIELARTYFDLGHYQQGIDTLSRGAELVNLPESAPQYSFLLDQFIIGFRHINDTENELKYLRHYQKLDHSGHLQANRNLFSAREIKRKYDQERANQKRAARELELLKDSHERLTILNDIAHQIAMTLDFKQLGKRLFDIFEKHFGIHFISLSTLVKGQQKLRFEFVYESGELIDSNDIALTSTNSYNVRALYSEEPIYIEDVASGDLHILIGDVSDAPCSMLFLRLVLEKQVLGVFSIQSLEPSRFQEHEIELIVAICNFISIAVSNIQSHEQVRQLNKILYAEKLAIENAHERIEHIAYHDSLTSLPNRQALEEFVERRISATQRPFHIVYIDLNSFKPINDQHGHRIGDQVLIEIAKRIKFTMRGRDFAARIGGDEFVLVIDEIATDADLNSFLQRILTMIEKKILTPAGVVSVSASIGSAHYPDCGQNLDALMHSADREMYAVKRTGKGGIKLSGC